MSRARELAERIENRNKTNEEIARRLEAKGKSGDFLSKQGIVN